MKKIAYTVIAFLTFISITFGQIQDQHNMKCMIDLDDDKTYSFTSDSIKIEPIIGENEFLIGFYKALRYPPSARKNGIQGTVILEIYVDKNGLVEKTEIVKSLQKECDEASLKAFLENSHQGYYPVLINGKAKNFKFQVPVKFKLE